MQSALQIIQYLPTSVVSHSKLPSTAEIIVHFLTYQFHLVIVPAILSHLEF